MLVCEKCNKEFDTKYLLKRHMNRKIRVYLMKI